MRDAAELARKACEIDDALEAEGFTRPEIAHIAGAIRSLSLGLMPPAERARFIIADMIANGGAA